MSSDMLEFSKPSEAIDCDNKEVMAFAKEKAGDSGDQVDQAVSLYYAVRDGIRYDPYSIDLSIKGLLASTTLRAGRGWCVAKAALLAACCRAIRIPARVGFADVINHLSTERMRKMMKTNVFYWHGFTSIYLNQRWVKATPAFNIELCRRFRLKPIEFNGREDSLYHSFDLNGNKHMEYIRHRGEFKDIPIAEIMETFQKEYSPELSVPEADFDHEVEEETKPAGA